VLVGTVMLAFAVGGAALITHVWWLFWACVGVVVLAIPAGKMIGILGDTVAWETSAALAESSTEPPGHAPQPAPAGKHRVESPGPD
jgi:hypothetical protein